MTLHSLSSSFPRRTGRWAAAALLLAGFLLLAGCQQTGDMYAQPRYVPLGPSDIFPNGQSARLPVAGSVQYASTETPNSPAFTGLDDAGQPVKGFPVKVDKALVQQGMDRYNIYCIPCHGPAGEGNGKAVSFGFPKPPDLLGSTAKALANGEIFQIIQNGRGKMFSYGYRVNAQERWAIAAYIRALELKNGAVDPNTLTPAEIDQIGSQQ
jgi:mono/diheme cytochrome c family protein